MEIIVGGRLLKASEPALLVAEIGGNHGGDPNLAWQMVMAAAKAGAGAIKFQAYQTAEFLSLKSPYYGELAAEELPLNTLGDLMIKARKLGLVAGLTVFDQDSLSLAQETADFIKISSGDLTYHQLLAQVAEVDLPIFLSTGAATAEEVTEAQAVLAHAQKRLVLLQCTALYPAPPEAANLGVMTKWLSDGLGAGYSDHVMGPESAIMALALGAMVLEKHFTTSRKLPGGDNEISSEPEEFKVLSRFNNLRATIRGSSLKAPHPQEKIMRPIIHRTLVATGDFPMGHILQKGALAPQRPASENSNSNSNGEAEPLSPNQLPKVMGRVLLHPLLAGETLHPEYLANHG